MRLARPLTAKNLGPDLRIFCKAAAKIGEMEVPKKMCLSRTWFNGRAQFANPLHTSLLILLVVKPSPDVGGRFNDQISEPTPATLLPGRGIFLVFSVPVWRLFALLVRSRRRINDQRSRTGRYSRTVSKAPVRILIRSPASLGKPDGS